MKSIIKFLIFFFILTFLTACNAAREGFTLKKKNSADEFLVEKKSPLVLPPDYGKLPFPESDEKNEEKNEDFKKLIKSSADDSSNKNNASSLEESILQKID